MKKLFFFIGIAIIAFSCKTVESQERTWSEKFLRIQKAKENYPYLAELLDAQMVDAKEEYDMAQEIISDEDKIDQLDVAIMKLSTAPFKNIYEFENALKEIKSTIHKVKTELTSKEYTNKISAQVDYAQQQLQAAKELQTKKFDNADRALQSFRNTTKLLEEEISDLNMIYNSVMAERQRIKDSIIKSKEQSPQDSLN